MTETYLEMYNRMVQEKRDLLAELEAEREAHRETARNVGGCVSIELHHRVGKQLHDEIEAHRQTKAALKAQHELRVFLIERMSAIRDRVGRRPQPGMGDGFNYGYCLGVLEDIASEVETFFNFIEGEERKDG